MPSPEYMTKDPYLASFLVCQGATLRRCRRPRPKRYRFWFAADPYLHALLRLYWSGNPAFVVPARLFATLHTLKHRAQKSRAIFPADPFDDASL
jgi:hypothetical protein